MGRMLSICQTIVLSRLNTLTNFVHDDAIQTTINQSGSAEEINEAESIVSNLMVEWGTVILGGDLLTVERIEQNKGLRVSNLSYFERLGFLGSSRVAIFHFRQNILLKLFSNLLPNLEDSNNPGSLNCFRALTVKAKDLSNRENKIKDCFELHHQFLLSVSAVYMEEKLLTSFEERFGKGDLKTFALEMKSKPETEVAAFLDDFINDSSINIFFDRDEDFDKSEDKTKDDLENVANLFVSVWFLLRSLDFITKSGDPDGVQFYKKNSLLLTLSLHSTSSKYVHQLFLEMMRAKQMSERERLRWSSGHFIKYHGRQSTSDRLTSQDMNLRSEDIVCEWLVEKTKNTLKSLGGNYTEETIEKKTKATSLVNAILEHDSRSLLSENTSGPGHSWDRFDDEELKRFKDYVQGLKPFR